MTARAQRIIRHELGDSLRQNVVKANLQDAKGTLAFTVSGEPPYVVQVNDLEIEEPPISALMTAAERQDTSSIVWLVSHYHNVNQRELASGRSALHNACAARKVKSLEQLLALGADPNASDVDEDTPLTVAVTANSIPAAKSLISAGAQVNRADDVGDTPLIRAAELGRTNMIRFLLQSGADRNFKAQDGKTALTIAQENHNQEAMKMLKKTQ